MTPLTAPVYLDHASITAPSPAALRAMHYAAKHSWGQPGSRHDVGWRAERALEEARQQICSYMAARWPTHVVFTSSGREALRLAMHYGLLRAERSRSAPLRVVASRQDHPAMQDAVALAATAGHHVEWLALPEGVANEADRAMVASADLVALSAVNHELGTSSMDLLEACDPGTIRVVDAVQWAPWKRLDSLTDERTFYAISGPKLGTPRGVAAAYIPWERADAREAGEGAEIDAARSREPWLMAVGLGAACAVRRHKRDKSLAWAQERASELIKGLQSIEPGLRVNGAPEARLGPIVNVSFADISGKTLAASLSLERVFISHTSACQAALVDLSPVVRHAYPDDPWRANNATRWSVSERTTESEILGALGVVARVPRRSLVSVMAEELERMARDSS